MQQEPGLTAGELTGRHLGHRVDVARTDRGEVLAGGELAGEHRRHPGQPAAVVTEVTVRWQPDVVLRVGLRPAEPVTVITLPPAWARLPSRT